MAPNELLDLWPEDEGFWFPDRDSRRVDCILDQSQHLLRDSLRENLEGLLERVDGIDQIDIQIVDVHELSSHQNEALVAHLLDLTVLDDRVRDDVLPDLLYLFL